jgi:hypothetical protein
VQYINLVLKKSSSSIQIGQKESDEGPPTFEKSARGPEPEFLNILKCNSAESASRGYQVNFIIFLMIKLTVIIGFQPLFRSVKTAIKQLF